MLILGLRKIEHCIYTNVGHSNNIVSYCLDSPYTTFCIHVGAVASFSYQNLKSARGYLVYKKSYNFFSESTTRSPVLVVQFNRFRPLVRRQLKSGRSDGSVSNNYYEFISRITGNLDNLNLLLNTFRQTLYRCNILKFVYLNT